MITGSASFLANIDVDLAQPHPMNRLLQGEVGSGKTLVALRAMLRVVDSGGQAALLAPTEAELAKKPAVKNPADKNPTAKTAAVKTAAVKTTAPKTTTVQTPAAKPAPKSIPAQAVPTTEPTVPPVNPS